MLRSLSVAYRSWAFKVTIWLVLAAIAAGLTFMVWVASSVKPTKNLRIQNNANPVVTDPIALLATRAPEETKQMVKPISFDAVIRDMRNYPKEFKDAGFIKAHQGKWTLQIMNVVENEVITDYLDNREDRDKFSYFRVIDENNQKRFVLTYGAFDSAQQAMTMGKDIDFKLPNNIAPFPEEFQRYAAQMDEYEITPPLKDLGSNAPKAVKLRSTQKELPAPKAKPKPQSSNNSTKQSNNEATKTDKPTTRSIKESNDQRDTLNIQEKKVNRTSDNAPKSEPKPLPVELKEPPPLSQAEKPQERPREKVKPVTQEAEPKQSAPKREAPPPEPTAETN